MVYVYRLTNSINENHIWRKAAGNQAFSSARSLILSLTLYKNLCTHPFMDSHRLSDFFIGQLNPLLLQKKTNLIICKIQHRKLFHNDFNKYSHGFAASKLSDYIYEYTLRSMIRKLTSLSSTLILRYGVYAKQVLFQPICTP